ncbi:MAG TPA: L,D-transpeptidase family protein [Phototrophicaceae bacterium]|nr:L,D-transpeptidase family protein [Phototrophicaceae bacterium]
MTLPNTNQPQFKTRPKTPSRRQRWLPWLVVGGVALTGFLMFLGLLGVVLLLVLTANRLPSGVQVAGIPVGGQSPEAAAALLQQKIGSPLITFVDGERRWQLPLADIGAQIDMEASLAAAQAAKSGANVPLIYTIDLGQAQFGLLGLSEQVNIAPTTTTGGRALDIPVLLDRLRVDASGELADGVFELELFAVDPVTIEPGDSYSGETTTHVVEAGQELGLIAKLYNVSMQDIINLNGIQNPDLLYVGQELSIPAAGMYEPTAADAPIPSTSTGKAIVVEVDNQRIYAYENGQLVHSHLVSTGLPATPTVKGDYSIYVKYVADDMQGPDYFLPQVPYTMYFFQGYGIHGTYWHNSFGRPMSHGCVNLPTDEAEWFFNWAEVGTPVRVI